MAPSGYHLWEYWFRDRNPGLAQQRAYKERRLEWWGQLVSIQITMRQPWRTLVRFDCFQNGSMELTTVSSGISRCICSFRWYNNMVGFLVLHRGYNSTSAYIQLQPDKQVSVNKNIGDTDRLINLTGWLSGKMKPTFDIVRLKLQSYIWNSYPRRDTCPLITVFVRNKYPELTMSLWHTWVKGTWRSGWSRIELLVCAIWA